jgi:hypothetical protein
VNISYEINIGLDNLNDPKTINIGGANDVINIFGNTTYVSTTNLAIKDKTI